MMIALRRLMSRNRIFIKENTIEQRRERYAIAANPIEAFLEDAVDDDSVESDAVVKARFYRAYTHFCSNLNLAILSKESLGKILKNKFQEGRESSGKRETLWKGIKLTEKYAIESLQQTLEV